MSSLFGNALSKGRTARSFGGLRMTVKSGWLSSPGLYPIIVILRPPKDLAVLPCTNKSLCYDNHPIFVIPRPPRDLVFPPHTTSFHLLKIKVITGIGIHGFFRWNIGRSGGSLLLPHRLLHLSLRRLESLTQLKGCAHHRNQEACDKSE
jgi:hypothetical protein